MAAHGARDLSLGADRCGAGYFVLETMMRLDEVKRLPTSEEWRAVRQFVQEFRTKAHELVVDKTVVQEILGLQDALGMELLEEMITHEKRLIGMNVTQRFWMEKDARDEADYEAQTTNRPIRDAEQSEADHGV